MKKSKLLAVLLAFGLCFTLTACQNPLKGATQITLSDEQIMVDGVVASTSEDAAVYLVQKDEHTIVNITQPGNYALNGELSLGQVVVDLGEDAKTNPEAVVTLVLNNANITCEVAPAIVFYNAYECVTSETIDTSKAGANIFVADKTVNTVNGAYVEDTYEAAIYSTVSMNIDGGRKNSGTVFVSAIADKGDAIASSGYITINGGSINAYACATAANAGISSDKEIFINGGNVVSTGHVYDEINENGQNFAVFQFVESQVGGNIFEVKNAKEKTVFSAPCNSDFTILTVSGKALKEATSSFWCEDVQFFAGEGFISGFMGDPSMTAPEGMLPNTDAELDEANANIVFDIKKGENIYHVFY